ncbi:MAG: pyrroline-5-carboxylate reductase [Oscillospiraceae bacterium]|nr:pyrroline-5-carboxylate reductase [Oscillospiraceae bacterium]
MKTGIIGIGNMGSAILKSMLSSGVCDAKNINIFDINEQSLEPFKNTGVVIHTSGSDAARASDCLILVTKPQNMRETLSGIKNGLRKETVIVSIAAGLGEDFFTKALGRKPKLALVMPNTPLLLGEGATALSKAGRINDTEFEYVRKIFASSGKTIVFDKAQMNSIIALNGSSPAFIYLFAKGFIQYAKDVGLDEKSSLELFCASLTGAACMMTDSGHNIDELIKIVSSPGGTTVAGLKTFGDADFTDIVVKACNSVNRRAQELAQEYSD